MKVKLATIEEAAMEDNAGELDETFRRNGCCLIRLKPTTSNVIRKAMEASVALFRQPAEVKAAFVDSTTRVGYRSVGIEYSQSLNRPDLMESLSYSIKHEGIIHGLAQGEAETEWRKSSRAGFQALDLIFIRLLNTLHSSVSPGRAVPYKPFPDSFSANGSFLQTNHYTSELMSRSILQDCHEDANLVTLLLSDADGLELSLDRSSFVGCSPPADCLLAFSGSLMTKLSRGRYPTVYHRVVRLPHVMERKSMMYFANPSPDEFLFPWGTGGEENLAQIAAESPQRFGLPKLA
ncbi:hypothetical protein PYH37_000047 [Sinorhizobium numidicum]|uniref:2-oxoglutarate-dependent ethylene/succinate-forming enzyme n=1 Tax=Sinorhizobium numidicum TaxID=680248 RepID=A0ABY8CU57_9HYPH|nr:2OG-Fe(II) oxygenase family protein [Sinorhizobium numidicum]WEX74775.1 hypothetical protein PYH37_000047 [Sinorhizobium numidicum]WEX80768.1 hypothetical protein PYH38_000049 [Sinorhizobium numidicum]